MACPPMYGSLPLDGGCRAPHGSILLLYPPISHSPAPAQPPSGQPEGHVHSAIEGDGRGQGRRGPAPAGRSRHTACPGAVAVAGAGACPVPQPGPGLLIVGFGLRDIGGGGVGLDDAKLVQRARLVPTCFLLPGQVERLACVLPGLLAVSRQTTHLAEPRHPVGIPRARADTFADRLLQQRTPLRQASLERRGRAQARREPWQPDPVGRRHDRGPGPAPTPEWRAPGPLGRDTGGRGSRGQ